MNIYPSPIYVRKFILIVPFKIFLQLQNALAAGESVYIPGCAAVRPGGVHCLLRGGDGAP